VALFVLFVLFQVLFQVMKTRKIHVDLALLVLGLILLSTQDPLSLPNPPPFSLPPPLFLFFPFLFLSFLLLLSPSSFLLSLNFPYFLILFFLCVTVCVYLRMCVRAYLALPCVSASDNVNHIKLNIRYVCDKINELN